MALVVTLTTLHQLYKIKKGINFKSFSNIKVCLKILRTLPVTACTCELSFSSTKILKIYAGSTMISETLNGIVLMHVHHENVPNIE